MSENLASRLDEYSVLGHHPQVDTSASVPNRALAGRWRELFCLQRLGAVDR